ncbi:MAG: hypothetical protein KBT14_00170 [Proteobacteria bacterium]|nr:hypothetical protein [Candidatus Enterousia onthequi]
MKNIFILMCVCLLSACGAIGIGSNHNTIIYNNSSDVITASSTSGVYKIKPENSLAVYSTDEITLQSKKSNCQQVKILSKPNGDAILLDIIPGALFGIIPILVDAVTNNLYKMPEYYNYTCD